MTEATKKVFVPGLKHSVHFQDRHAMKRGHPVRRFHCPNHLWKTLPTPTLPIDWTKGDSLPFLMYGNDQYGDCMYAMACHQDNTWTGNAGTESTFNEQTLVQDYLQLAGGDNGLDEGTLITGWKQGLAGVPSANILDSIDIDATNDMLVAQAIYLFGGVQFMFDVPDAWINSFNPNGSTVWDAPARADRNNGHGVLWNGMDTSYRRKLQTWGGHVWLTSAGVKVCDPSAFVSFSLRWFNSQGYAPNGLHYTTLSQYWVAFGGNANALPSVSPFPAPSPTPPPVPQPPAPPVPGNGVTLILGSTSFTIPDGTYNLGAAPTPVAGQALADVQGLLPVIQKIITELTPSPSKA